MPSEKFSFKPFPNIARFPEREEREASEENNPDVEITSKEPPLEGPPKNPEESAFYIKPNIGQVVEIFREYDNANSEKRHNLTSRLTSEVANNPTGWQNFYDALAIIEQEGEDVPEIKIQKEKIDELKARVAKSLENPQFKPFPPKPEQLEGWLTLLGESALYKAEADKMLRKMVEKCKNPKEITDFFYNLALAGLTSSNDNVVKKTLEILCLETDIIKLGDGQLSDHLIASYDLNDDILKKAMEIDHGVFFMTTLKGFGFLDMKTNVIEQVMNDKKFVERLKEISISNPQRFEAIFNLYQQEKDKFNLVAIRDINAFPFNLTGQPGPLRTWFNERIAEELERRSGKPAVNLHLPLYEGAVNFESLEDAALYIKEHLNQANPEGKTLGEEKYWQSLTYLAPLISDKQLEDLIELNGRLINDLKYEIRYLLNPSGDKIIITDKTLTDLGYKHIQFDMDSRNRRDTIITLTVGNFSYRVLIDDFISLRDAEKIEKNVNLPKTGPFSAT